MFARRTLAAVVAVAALAGCSTRLGNYHGDLEGPRYPRPAAYDPYRAQGAAAVAAVQSFALSAENTRVTFIGSAWKSSHEGGFERLTGRLDCPTSDPKDVRLYVEIDTDSVFTKIGLLTRHLKGQDFFDVAKYPRATFVSSQIDPARTPDATHLVTGDFTIHGQTRRVVFPARLAVTGEAVTLGATIVVKQSEFGMNLERKTDDEVPVTVSLRVSRR
jgi:polyisoprenoid-binding protein YceI